MGAWVQMGADTDGCIGAREGAFFYCGPLKHLAGKSGRGPLKHP